MSEENKKAEAIDPGTGAGPAYDRWNLQPESSIDYGYFSGAGIDKVSSYDSENEDDYYYITTAINYTNGPAHMGHAYEAATSDVIARFQRLTADNKKTYFVTGADEHGQKIADTAAAQSKQPIEICDKYVTGFKCLNQRILISNEDYIRTTSDRHKKVARELWKRCHDNGDIYLDTYEGWYNIREETFVTDSEAALSDYKDPTSGLPLKRVEEKSYFFKMSKYRDQLIHYIEVENPNFIRPEMHKNQILTRLKSDDLRDLSISRTTFSWGIRVPEGFEQDHVMYVWVDALSNYLTGVNALRVDDAEIGSPEGLHKFWPANVHIIGKDILWFHTVIWPCLLFSAKLPLPKTVFAHGFVNDKDGKKMSKTMGNVVDPHDMLDKFHVDTFRWYLCKEASYGGELSFSEDSMRDMHNSDLCDTLGNLVHRATSLCGKFCNGGVIPDVPAPADPPVADFNGVCESYTKKMDSFELQAGASIAIQAFRDLNKYLDEASPWKKKGDEFDEYRQIVVRATLEAIYALGHLLLPFLPLNGKNIFQKLNTPPVFLSQLNKDFRNLKVGTKIDVGDVLYVKVLSEEEINNAGEASQKKKESYLEAQKRKKEKKMQQIAASNKGKGDAGPDQPEFTKMDIRVGQIVKVWNHPEADKLYCEQIDVGEETGPREIASGLRDFYSLEDMHNRKVLVVCNLKPAKLAGFTSNGMVLAAKSEDGKQVELITAPADAPNGERVFIEGLSGEPITSTQVKKKKTWEAVAKDLKTKSEKMESGVLAAWDGKIINTSAGPCKAATLLNAPIS